MEGRSLENRKEQTKFIFVGNKILKYVLNRNYEKSEKQVKVLKKTSCHVMSGQVRSIRQSQVRSPKEL